MQLIKCEPTAPTLSVDRKVVGLSEIVVSDLGNGIDARQRRSGNQSRSFDARSLKPTTFLQRWASVIERVSTN